MSKALLHVHVADFELPPSNFLSEASRQALSAEKNYAQKQVELMADSPMSFDVLGADETERPAVRQAIIDMTKSSPDYLNMQKRYPTIMHEEVMGGVLTEVFIPEEGVAEKNADLILINLHGGSFVGGERSGSHLESIPIASVGGIKVVSVDYRMAPEYQFPAASDDVLKVYKHLLTTYAPESIGIYGSSAGAVLTSQVVARIQHEDLPKPGAVAMLAGAAFYWMEGDSGHIGCAISGITEDSCSLANDLYFKGVDPNDSLAFPGRSQEVIAHFPPSLLIASTRDFALSSVVQTHSQLVAQGVQADLHIWEGLDHVFYFNGELRESREVYQVVAQFFDKHLK